MDRGAWRATVHRVPRVHRVARVGHDQAHTYKKYKKTLIKKHTTKKKKHYRLLEQCMEGSTEVFT